MNTVAAVQPMPKILDSNPSAEMLTQFILDCSIQIPALNPGISEIYHVVRESGKNVKISNIDENTKENLINLLDIFYFHSNF